MLLWLIAAAQQGCQSVQLQVHSKASQPMAIHVHDNTVSRNMDETDHSTDIGSSESQIVSGDGIDPYHDIS